MEYNASIDIDCHSNAQRELLFRLCELAAKPIFDEDIASDDKELWIVLRTMETPSSIRGNGDHGLFLTFETPPCDSDVLVAFCTELSSLVAHVGLDLDEYDWGGRKRIAFVNGKVVELITCDDSEE